MPILSIDRLSTVRYKVAKFLKVQPEQLYTELHIEDNIRVVPFKIIPYEYYTKQYTDQVKERPSPSQYNQKNEKDIQLGPLIIPKALFTISKQYPKLIYNQAIQLQYNREHISTFVSFGQKIKIDVLLIQTDQVQQINELAQHEEYQFPVSCQIYKYFPYTLTNTPGYKSENSFLSEQDLITNMITKWNQKPDQDDLPNYRFNFKSIDIWHDLNQQVQLRQIFNDIAIQPDIQFIRHTYIRKDRYYTATKCSINDNPESFEYAISRVGPTFEHILFGINKSNYIRIFSNGRLMLKYMINQSELTPDSNKFKEEAMDVLMKYVDIINALQSQYIPFHINSESIRFNVQVGIYISYKHFQPIHASRALFNVLQAEDASQQVDSFQVIRSSALMDSQYSVRLQHTAEYLLVDYDGSLINEFYVPFLIITYTLAEQFSKHSSTQMRKRDYHEAHDPELYGNLNNRYSRLCQGEHKPAFTSKPGANTYQYWNFTTKNPQLYKCPDQYPNLYFITGKHKLNYCVPCCASSQAPKEVFSQCMEKHQYTRRQLDNKQYVLKKEMFFQVGRHTVLNKQIANQFDYGSATILCLTYPEYSSIQEQINSLARCIQHSLHMEQLFDELIQRSQLNQDEQFNMAIWVDAASKLVSKSTNNKVSLLVVDLDEQSFYANNFSQMLICIAQTKQIYNPIHFGNKYKIPISNFKLANQLIEHIQKQMNQMPEQIINHIQLQVTDIKQIVDMNGMCRYIVGSRENKVLMIPTVPQFTDKVPVQQQFPQPHQLMLNTEKAIELINKLGINIQYKLLDEQNKVCGLLANGLMFPVVPTESHEYIEAIKPYNTRVNPLLVNKEIKQIDKQQGDMHSVYISLYIDYLYDLLIMQNPTQEQDIEFMPLAKVIEYLQKRIDSKQSDTVPTELRSCKQNQDQFFCSGKKIVIADIHRELVREVNKFRRLAKDVPIPVQLIIAEVEFKNLPNERIYIKFINKV